jgi:hypothetical protein
LRSPVIVLCTPVYDSFTPEYVLSVLSFKDWCMSNGISLIASFAKDPIVGFARSKCLGASSIDGKDQKPWRGQMKYDWILWVDSDIEFTPEHVLTLIRARKDVVSGLYRMNSDEEVWCAGYIDLDHFAEHGYMPRLKGEVSGLQKVDWCGMGFMLIRRGVFERLSYPWFTQQVVEGPGFREATSEDVGFCLKLRDAGIDIWVHGGVVVGHVKPRLLT